MPAGGATLSRAGASARDFFASRRWRLVLLAVLGLDVFAVPTLHAMGLVPERLADAFFACTMAVAIAAASVKRRAHLLVWLVGGAAILLQAAHLVSAGRAVAIADAAISGAALLTFAGLLLADALHPGSTADHLLDVLLVYVLIGAAYAAGYEVIDLAAPGALSFPRAGQAVADYVYFSFSTMLSVGFGDVLPIHPAARAVAVLEALTGQLYVAVLIARFVQGGTAPTPSRTR